MAKVVIYTKPTCPYCAKALGLLDSKAVDYQVIDISNDAQKQAEMKALSGRHTVPQLFINEQAMGGCDDLFALDACGELDQLLLL